MFTFAFTHFVFFHHHASMQSDAIVDELQKSNTLCLLLDMVARPAPLLRVPHLRKRFATRACPDICVSRW
jgi:hypothetical protein